MKGIKLGISVEKEHKPTYNFLKKYVQQHHKLPSQKVFYAKIAKNHLRETPQYYKRLIKAGL